MPNDHTTVEVDALPECDICADGTPAAFDAKTNYRVWANLCSRHFKIHTGGKLGLGFGQRLIVRQPRLTQTITIPLDEV